MAVRQGNWRRAGQRQVLRASCTAVPAGAAIVHGNHTVSCALMTHAQTQTSSLGAHHDFVCVHHPVFVGANIHQPLAVPALRSGGGREGSGQGSGRERVPGGGLLSCDKCDDA